MGWTHILGEIGKGALKGASMGGQVLGGPLGALVTIGSNIGLAEFDHPPQSGQVKQGQVQGQVLGSQVLNQSPLPADSKIGHVKKIIDAILVILNSLGELFPPKTESPQVPKVSP